MKGNSPKVGGKRQKWREKKTKIVLSYLVEERSDGGELALELLLLSQGGVLEVLLNLRGGGGGNLVLHLVVEEVCLVSLLT